MFVPRNYLLRKGALDGVLLEGTNLALILKRISKGVRG